MIGELADGVKALQHLAAAAERIAEALEKLEKRLADRESVINGAKVAP